MGIIIDVVIVAFIVISALVGYKKGLSEILVSIIGVVLALILGFTLKGTLASFIDQKTGIGVTLQDTIADGINAAIDSKVESLENKNQTSVEEQTDENTVNSSENVQDETISEEIKTEGIKEEKQNGFYTSLVEKMGITDGTIVIAQKVSNFILETASFILIFVLVTLCTFILKMMLNLVCKLPLLAQVNGVGGLVAGTLMSVIKVWVVLAVLSFLAPMFSQITNIVETTYVTKLLYDINLIVLFLSGDLRF